MAVKVDFQDEVRVHIYFGEVELLQVHDGKENVVRLSMKELNEVLSILKREGIIGKDDCCQRTSAI